MEAFDATKDNKYYFDKYVEIYVKYDLYHQKYLTDCEKKRIVANKHAQNLRNVQHFCSYCNIHLSSSGYPNHLKSKKHHNNVLLKQNIQLQQQNEHKI
jgi:hypothetical protein